MTTVMDTNTLITIPCNEKHCSSFGVGHEEYWSAVESSGDEVHQARAWEGDYYLIVVERLEAIERWAVNVEMDKALDGFHSSAEIEQFVTDLREASRLLEEVSR